ncbi:MAG: sensor histidine kinase [Lachnospiraceae bacterium]|nr:sensor histidine kinase [Lachnospiraceae bacterium]
MKQVKSLGKVRSDKLEKKLTKAILLVTLLGFVAILFAAVNSVYQEKRSYEIRSQMDQEIQTASQIAFFQHTISNIAKQLTMNTFFKKTFSSPSGNLGERLSDKREIHNMLASNAHLIDSIEEIMIYTADGETLSSREIRGGFDPEKNEWFKEFVASKKTEGYSSIHDSEPRQDGYHIPVISYITEYHPLDKRDDTAYIIINIDRRAFEDMTGIRSELIDESCLFSGNGDIIAGQGETVKALYQELSNDDSEYYFEKEGNIYISVGGMMDGFRLLSRVSGRELYLQCLNVAVPLLIIIPVIVLVMLLVLHFYVRRIVDPLNELGEAAAKVGRGDFDVITDIHTGDEIETTANAFNGMVRDIKELMDESLEHEKKLHRMSMENLLLQINPHFIYNTMNSIVYMAKINKNNEIAQFTNHFISLLQKTLKIRKSVFTTLESELDTVRHYLYLQEFRYGNRFEYEFDVKEEILKARIPGMMIQPVVENAIFHGLAPKTGKGSLAIKGSYKDGILILTIEDDGIGMDAETVSSLFDEDKSEEETAHRIGIANVRKRISEIYKDRADMVISSTPGQGTKVMFTIPFEEDSVTEDAEE